MKSKNPEQKSPNSDLIEYLENEKKKNNKRATIEMIIRLIGLCIIFSSLAYFTSNLAQ